MLGCGIYLSDVQPVGDAYCLTVYLLSSNDEYRVVRAASLHGHSYRTINLNTVCVLHSSAYNYVAPARKRSVGQRLEGMSAHNHCVSQCQFPKPRHVFSYMEKQAVAVAYGSVGSYGGNNANHSVSIFSASGM